MKLPHRRQFLHLAAGAAPYLGRSSTGWIAPACLAHSFDHLVGAGEQRRRDFKPKRPGGGQVDDEIELSRLLDREIARLRPAKNLVDIVANAPKKLWEVWSIGHQTSRFDVLPLTVNRRQSRGEHQGVDASPVGEYEPVASDIKRLRAALERLERGHDVFRATDFERDDIEAERVGRCLNLAHLLYDDGITDITQESQAAEAGDYLAQEFESAPLSAL